jgi:PKD repeat protein
VKGSVRLGFVLLVSLFFFILIVSSVTAYTTEVTVTKLARDNLTIINNRTVSYQWMRDNLPILGDGTTHYYMQGPVFIDDPTNETHEQELRWNPEEDTNCYPDKDFGALRGTNVTALCNLVGGMSPGEEVKVQSFDGWNMKFAYTNVYLPPARTGPMVITWEQNGMYPDNGYNDGMRLVWFSDTSVNPWGQHVFGNFDWHESAAPQYWYYYASGGERYPTTTGLSGQIVSDLIIYSKTPVPAPVADFTANIRTGHLINGNFETGIFSPWINSSSATIHTGSATYRKGTASVKLTAPAGGTASIAQNADLTNVASINLWRYQFGGTGNYVEVLVDTTVIANYSESSTISNKYETIDITQFGFTGNHIIKVNAVSGSPSLFTTYIDEIFDFGPGTSGPAPLTIQFKDVSTKMQDPAHTSWAWDFYNNGTAISTERNPLFTYPANGTYTVKLTATNAGGSDIEIKTGYVTVGSAISPPVANFTAAPKSGTAPLTVQFNDTSTNTPTSWRWAYRNATVGWTNFSTLKNTTYSFGTGTYDINLTATNGAGSDDEIKTGYITVGTITPYIDVSISGSIDNWNFQTGPNEDTTSVDLTVDTNMDNWSVGAMDALTEGKPAGTAGKMAEWSGISYVSSGKVLANALQVKSANGSYHTVSGTNQPVQGGTAQGFTSYDIGMKQQVDQTDSTLIGNNRYRIVVTFTGGAA